jgi:hypothetical protein
VCCQSRFERQLRFDARTGKPYGFAELKAKLKLTRGQHEPTIRESAGLDGEFGQRRLAVTINRASRA